MQPFKPVDRIVADATSPGITYQPLHASAINTSGWRSFGCFIMLSDASGTSPVINVKIQQAADHDASSPGETHWVDLKEFGEMHLSGTYSIDVTGAFASWIRIVGKVGGTHPHFKMSAMLSPRE